MAATDRIASDLPATFVEMVYAKHRNFVFAAIDPLPVGDFTKFGAVQVR